MTCNLTEEERELIDRAIADGGVQRIPQGVCMGDNAVKRPPSVGRRRNLKRIAQIRSLSARRMTDSEIAETIGTTRKAVSKYRERYDIPSGYLLKRRC